jgi:hypothetical protein
MHENVDQFFGTHGFESNKSTLSMLGWIPTRTFPWNLALLWVLVRRLRGKREDSTGRFLVVWWAAITAFFFLVDIKRAVYLLPTYPAVALLAARALASVMENASRPNAAPLRWWQRAFSTPARAALAVALVDLVLILPNPMIWKRSASYKDRLAFIDEIGARVPSGAPLYAGPKLGESDLLIIAYRLRRTIERKPIACARPNEYFLSGKRPSDFEGESRRLAVSEKTNVVLAVVLAPPQGKPCAPAAPKHGDDSDTD